MRYLYTILFYLMLPFFFLRLLWRSRHTAEYRKRWDERLGFCPYRLEKCIWIHAVSVGETLAAIPLVKALKAHYPDIPLLITNMTITGAARVKAAFGDSVRQTYLPYDLPSATHRFLNRVHPIIAIMMETELWPNLYAACKTQHIPIVLVNARLSEHSARGYRLISPLTREMLTILHRVAAQGSVDANRFIELGLSAKKVTISGNIKFDLEIPANLLSRSETFKEQLGRDRLVWIAASTHPGEEEIILSAHRSLLEKIPSALLILVPRHPERFDTVAAMVTEKKFTVARRSQADICMLQTQVYLSDTMGEMLLMYAVADVAFVAGSFAKVGGHNMLEPAALRKPIITGPVLFNFAEISQLLIQAKGMLVVHNAAELVQCLLKFFRDANYRHEMGEHAYEVVEKNRGALQKQLQLIQDIL